MMESIIRNQLVVQAFDELLAKVHYDFAGLAFQNRVGPAVRWYVVVGNRNDKYQRITVRYGKGIAGKVIATGSPIVIDDFLHEIEGKMLEFPIMLAEKLISAYAVPLFYQGIPKGVLLVGRRERLPFSKKEQSDVNQLSQKLEEIVTAEI